MIQTSRGGRIIFKCKICHYAPEVIQYTNVKFPVFLGMICKCGYHQMRYNAPWIDIDILTDEIVEAWNKDVALNSETFLLRRGDTQKWLGR